MRWGKIPLPPPSGDSTPRTRGGDLLDAAIHDLAGLRHLFGAIKHLSAFGVPQEADFSPYAVVTVNMEFMNGVVGTFSYFPAGREVQKPAVGLRIFGTHGQIYLEDTDCGVVNLFLPLMAGMNRLTTDRTAATIMSSSTSTMRFKGRKRLRSPGSGDR